PRAQENHPPLRRRVRRLDLQNIRRESRQQGLLINVEGLSRMKMAARLVAGGPAGMENSGPLGNRQGGELRFLESGCRNRRDVSPMGYVGGDQPLPFAKMAIGMVMRELQRE